MVTFPNLITGKRAPFVLFFNRGRTYAPDICLFGKEESAAEHPRLRNLPKGTEKRFFNYNLYF